MDLLSHRGSTLSFPLDVQQVNERADGHPLQHNHKTKNQAVFTPSVLAVLALPLLEPIHKHGREPQLPQPLQQQ